MKRLPDEFELIVCRIMVGSTLFIAPGYYKSNHWETNTVSFWGIEVAIGAVALWAIIKVRFFQIWVLGVRPRDIIQDVDPSTLTPGPFRRDKLPPEIEARLRSIFGRLSEVDKTPVEETIDNFRRDSNLEIELDAWEAVADTYDEYLRGKDCDLETKKAVFSVVAGFLFSNGSSKTGAELVIAPLKPKDAEELRNHFYRAT